VEHQVDEAVRAMRALIPGFETCYLIDTAPCWRESVET
jgi:hypothetical protein